MRYEKMKATPVTYSGLTTGTPSFQLKQQNVVHLEPKKNKRNDYY
jgi:hypothetical protein